MKQRHKKLVIFIALVIIITCIMILRPPQLITTLPQMNTLHHENTESGDDPSPRIIIYNRVPKTASTSFLGIAKNLAKKLRFSIVYVKSLNRRWSLLQQVKLVHNISHWERPLPAIYHGHFSYIDFKKFGSDITPVYINMLRSPLDRLISSYYYLLNGDNYSGIHHQAINETFEECRMRRHYSCSEKRLWEQLQIVCGMDYFCSQVGNKQAVMQAKDNLLRRYLLVGITEQYDQFFQLLELLLPRFFRGATDILQNQDEHILRTTKKKEPVSEDVLAAIRSTEAWQLSEDFYQFAKKEFNNIYSEIVKNKKLNELLTEKPEYSFEAMRLYSKR